MKRIGTGDIGNSQVRTHSKENAGTQCVNSRANSRTDQRAGERHNIKSTKPISRNVLFFWLWSAQ